MCEVWNAKIVNYRSKPILTMCEQVRCYIMRKMVRHKIVLGTYIGKVAPVQQKRLDKQKLQSNHWHSVWTGDDDHARFEVHHHSTKLAVNLNQHTCTCNLWQLTGN